MSAVVPLCNGLANLCQIPVNEIMYGMAHNAMSSPSSGFVLFFNHLRDPIVESLDAGFRGLNFDLCNCNGDFVFCHGGDEVGCGIGRRDPIDTFDEINDWIIANPKNVLLILMEINQAADGPITLNDVQSIFEQVPNGFVDRIYHPDPTSIANNGWPTLQELITAQQQVLFFYNSGPHGEGEHPPGISYFYDYAMSTDYSYPDVDDLRDRTMGSCTINAAGGTRDFFLMNAFVTARQFGVQFVPSRDAAEEINTSEFCQPLVDACEQFNNGKKVNIVSVDFWNSGDLPAFVNSHNAGLIPPPPTESTPSPVGPTMPTESPTFTPSALPTIIASGAPSDGPSLFPSTIPTEIASGTPSDSPSMFPSTVPSDPPTTTTTMSDTESPSLFPSAIPSDSPTTKPTKVSSNTPSSPTTTETTPTGTTRSGLAAGTESNGSSASSMEKRQLFSGLLFIGTFALFVLL